VHSWHIHLAVAKRVNELLKLDENSFYIGAVIAELDKKIGKKASHFQKKEVINDVKVMLPSYIDYVKKYKDKLNNPVYMGYLIHLMTDYYFNKNTFSNYWVIENKIIVGAKLNNGNILYGDMASRRRLRINDYRVLDQYIRETGGYGVPAYSDEMYNNLKEFKLISLEKDDVFALIESVNIPVEGGIVRRIFKKRYKMYTKETMEACFEECIKFIEEYLKENIL